MDPTTALAARSVASYVAAWQEQDENARRGLLEQAWADDGVYLDPGGRADGREALVKHIAGFQEAFAGHTIEAATGVDAHDGYLRFGWRILGPDGNLVTEGVDFGTYDDTGMLTSIVGFFGPWPDKE